MLWICTQIFYHSLAVSTWCLNSFFLRLCFKVFDEACLNRVQAPSAYIRLGLLLIIAKMTH